VTFVWVLGLNAPLAGGHDVSACLVDGSGAVVAFAEEERFSRRRHATFERPARAADFCLSTAGIGREDIDVVAFGWDAPKMSPHPFPDDVETLRIALGWTGLRRVPAVAHVQHHLAHATSAFYGSTFREAGVLVADGSGEQEATTIWRFRDGHAPVLERSWPRGDSLGFAYDAASRWLGFTFQEAGKTMGLAAYGRARGASVPDLVDFTGDTYRLRVRSLLGEVVGASVRPDYQVLWAEYEKAVSAWRSIFTEIAGAPGPTEPVQALDTDPGAVLVAHTAQVLVENTMRWLAEKTRQATGIAELCVAGGVALNCSANGLLAQPVYVPPVPHDAGVALGAAWHVCPPRAREPLSPYLGWTVEGTLDTAGVDLDGLRREELHAGRIADLLLDGRIGAVVEGRAEAGPRALGHRSILAGPGTAEMRGRLNEVKNREPWRPFGPVAPAGFAADLWTDQGDLSRYMIGAARMTDAGRQIAPAAVHVDGTCRPQTLRGGEAPVVEAVLAAMARAGVAPVLLNTSFNDKGEPIVNTAAEAVAALHRMRLDFLALDGTLLLKR
jgi:carbamoyltransferase